MTTSTFDERERPILEALAEADARSERPSSDWVQEQTGLSAAVVGHALDALIEAEIADGLDVTSGDDDGSAYLDLRLRKAGRERLGLWTPPAAPPGASPAISGAGTPATILEVLIASPGDTVEQRDRVERAIHEWNSLHAVDMGVILLPRRWERDSYPASGDGAQAVVNGQIVDRSHILIGIFWTRLGTPTTAADSGTAEEIDRFIGDGKPAHLYISQMPVVMDSVDQAEYARLTAYREKLNEKNLLGSFADTEELARKVDVALTHDVRALVANGGSAPASPGHTTATRPAVAFEEITSGERATVTNPGPGKLEGVTVALAGGRFLLTSDHRRIGPQDEPFDDVGTLTPGSSRTYVVTKAWGSHGRLIISADGIDPIEVEVP